MKTLFELQTYFEITNFTNYDPWVWCALPGAHVTASYWHTTFGALNETNTRAIVITGFTRDNITFYTEVTSIANCVSTEKSFFWDIAAQVLYVHFEHAYGPGTSEFEYATFYGYCNEEQIDVENVPYMPLIESIPSLEQSQDLINYNELNFAGGSIILKNIQGMLDFLIPLKMYGNEARIYYLDDDDINKDSNGRLYADRADLKNLVSFFIEDRQVSLNQIDIRVQDKRKAENAVLPTRTLNRTDYPDLGDDYLDRIVPIGYGTIRECYGMPIDGDNTGTTVKFRSMELLTALGTPHVLIDNKWIQKTAVSSDLPNGSFTLNNQQDVSTATVSNNGSDRARLTKTGAFTDMEGIVDVFVTFSATYNEQTYDILSVDPSGNYIDISLEVTGAPTETADIIIYNGCRDSSGGVRTVKLVSPTGIAIANAADIITDLNARYADIEFTDVFYNVSEFTSESSILSTAGVLFAHEINLFDAIQQVQNGCNLGFRYEINAAGKRTLRIDDENRAAAFFVDHTLIDNIDDLPVDTDKDLVFGEATVNYNKSYVTENYLRVNDDTNKTYVRNTYRQLSKNIVDTIMTNETDANFRAAFDAARFKDIPEIATVELKALNAVAREWFMQARVLDIIRIALVPINSFVNDDTVTAGREYYGVKYAKIIGINPIPEENKNILVLKLLSGVDTIDSQTLAFGMGVYGV